MDLSLTCPFYGSDMIFTTSPKHIQLVLATEFQNFEKGRPIM